MDETNLGFMKSSKLKLLWNDLPEAIGVYMIKTPSKRYYYGYSNNIRQRIRLHCSDACRGAHDNKRLAASLLKYGIRCKVEVVQVCQTEEQAIELEEQYIKMFFNDPNNMNQTDASPKKALKAWERPNTRISYIMSIWSMQVVLFYSTKDRQRWLKENGNGFKYTNCYVKGYSITECKEKAIRAQLNYLWNAKGGGNCVFDGIWYRTISDAYKANQTRLKQHNISMNVFQNYKNEGCDTMLAQIKRKKLAKYKSGAPGLIRNARAVEWDGKKYRRICDLYSFLNGMSPEFIRKIILLGVTSSSYLNLVLEGCTNRENISCDLKVFMLGRWYPSYDSCQKDTGMGFYTIKKYQNYV